VRHFHRAWPSLIAALIALEFGTAELRAADSVDPASPEVKSAVVVVTASGILTSQGNIKVAEQGTGFFISKYGYLVTAYHLKSDLGPVAEESVSYELRLDALSSNSVPASPIFINQAADIMVLTAPVAQHDIPVLSRTTRTPAQIIPGRTKIFTGGYPSGYDYSVDEGIIKSMAVISPPVPWWTTSMTFKAGQSGSPIILEDGTVLGIAKGVDTEATSIGLLIPAKLVPNEYWDSSGQATANATAEAIAASPPARIVIETNSRTETSTQKIAAFKLTNSHCQPARTETYSVKATPGARIDPKSIRIDILSRNGGGGEVKTLQAEPSGFTISVLLANTGYCTTIPTMLGITRQTHDITAEIVGRITYTEILSSPTANPVTVADTVVSGGNMIPLPSVPSGQLVFWVIKPSGEKISFQPAAGEIITQNGTRVLDGDKVIQRIM
ncbi:MAG TPA: serine protease, partial [Stellaceae bacterium]|nr:serine protease [Stellaceae bacterium]